MRRLIFILPTLAFVVVAAFLAYGLTRDPSKIPSALLDRPIPDFDLPPLQGKSGGLSDESIKGKVALVNVFASWCGPCRIEHPILMKLAADRTVALYGINYKDRPEDATAWLRQLGDPYLSIGADLDGRASIDWGVYGVPETFLIDRDGRIRFKQVGPITPQVLKESILPLIARLEK